MFRSLLRPSSGRHTRIKKYKISQNVQLKSPNVTVNILTTPYGYKIANFLSLKTDKIGCVYVVS
jgi:hypothetical protein